MGKIVRAGDSVVKLTCLFRPARADRKSHYFKLVAVTGA